MSLGMQHILLVCHALTLLTALRSRTRAFDTSVNYGIIYKITSGGLLKFQYASKSNDKLFVQERG